MAKLKSKVKESVRGTESTINIPGNEKINIKIELLINSLKSSLRK